MECASIAQDVAQAMEIYSYGHTVFTLVVFGAGAIVGHWIRQLAEKSETA